MREWRLGGCKTALGSGALEVRHRRAQMRNEGRTKVLAHEQPRPQVGVVLPNDGVHAALPLGLTAHELP